MQKKISLKRFPVIFALLITLSCLGQPPTTKPYMWSPKADGDSHLNNFKSAKLNKMSKFAGLPNGQLLNFDFSLGNFWGLIKYFQDTYKTDFAVLHVYIGINPKKKLIPIFAPAKLDNSAGDIKYYILPVNFNPSAVKNFELPNADKITWTNAFASAMALETIDPTDPDNQLPGSVSIPSDTRYVTYCALDIIELMNVKNYYVSIGKPISDNALWYVGAYPNTGDSHGKYKKRILISFELLDNVGKNFYLESIPEFAALQKGKSKCPFLLKEVDNGQLCPTHCPL